MAPKGGNAKKESGKAKKAENEAKKKDAAAAEAERKEASKWDSGAKGKAAKEDKEEKRKAELARKAENARLLAEEEAGASSSSAKKAASKAGAGAKKNKQQQKEESAKPAGPGAIAAGGVLDTKDKAVEEREEPESFSATGLDDAIDLAENVTAKMDKASLGSQAAKGVDSHPERRFKAAFEAYIDRELPDMKKDHPGLRRNQYNERLYEQFKKSPENPFNQTNVSYDASKEEKLEALKAKRAATEDRLREKGRQ